MGDSTGDNNPYFKQYNIYRGIDNKNFTLIDSIKDKKLRSYTDKNTPNNKTINYCYTIRPVNACGKECAGSDTLSTFEQLIANPSVQKLSYVSVSDDNKSIRLAWPKTLEKDFAKYYLYKSTLKNSIYNLIKVFENPGDTSYKDSLVSVNDSAYCYYVIMRDTCDNYSPYGQTSCSILLKGYSKDFNNTTYWNPYQTWDEGVKEYQIWRRDPATNFVEINAVDSLQKRYDDDKLSKEEGKFYYYINAIQNTSIKNNIATYNSRSNNIELLLAPIVYAPSAFTLNADNVNDTFKWSAVYTKEMNVKIYNRWGQLVYETNDKKAYWDGLVDGQPAPVDVYHYLIYYTGYEGTSQTIFGNLTLLR